MLKRQLKQWLAALLLLIASFHTLSAAESDHTSLDHASEEALQKTIELLTNPEKRAKEGLNTQDAQYVDQQVQSIGGSKENSEAIYQLAAQIFQDLVQNSHGDVNQLKELLVKAKNDPKAFAESLSPEQKQKLSEIAKKSSVPQSSGPR